MNFMDKSEDEINEVPALIREGHRKAQNYSKIELGASISDLYEHGCKGCEYRIKPWLIDFCGIGGFRVNFMGTCDERKSNGKLWSWHEKKEDNRSIPEIFSRR